MDYQSTFWLVSYSKFMLIFYINNYMLLCSGQIVALEPVCSADYSGSCLLINILTDTQLQLTCSSTSVDMELSWERRRQYDDLTLTDIPDQSDQEFSVYNSTDATHVFSVLSKHKVTVEDAATYICNGNKLQQTTIARSVSQFSVQVSVTNMIVGQLTSLRRQTRIGDDAIAVCTMTSLPRTSLMTFNMTYNCSWYFGEKLLAVYNSDKYDIYHLLSTGSLLKINDAVKADEGRYRCSCLVSATTLGLTQTQAFNKSLFVSIDDSYNNRPSNNLTNGATFSRHNCFTTIAYVIVLSVVTGCN